MVDNLMGFTTFNRDASKCGEKYITLEDDSKANIETPILILISAGFVEWMAAAPRTPWGLHVKIMSLLVGTTCDTPPPSPMSARYWCLHAAQTIVGLLTHCTSKRIRSWHPT